MAGTGLLPSAPARAHPRAARAFRAGHVDRRGEDEGVAREFAPEEVDLVVAMEADADFLEARHVGIGDAAGLARDARGIHGAVEPLAPLHVPAEEAHYLRSVSYTH